MIKKALLAGLEQGIIAPEELYGLDDQGLFGLLESRGEFPLFSRAARIRDGALYTESASFLYDNEKHEPLLDIRKRRSQEEALAAEITRITGKSISAEDLIIDVPEPVSFEADLFISDENCAFKQSSSIFRDKGTDLFGSSLRIVRIFTAFSINIPESILHYAKNWIQ